MSTLAQVVSNRAAEHIAGGPHALAPARTDGRTLALTGGTVDLLTRAVRFHDRGEGPQAGRSDRLTLREAELLAYLARRPGETVPREEILTDVFGYLPNLATRAVDTAVSRLRAKIELDPDQPVHVISVYGEGYRFQPAVTDRPRARKRVGIPPERTPLVGRGREIAEITAAVGADRL
ncbi:MAG: helix-turn-helix domain-containing protein, partial [Myxococcota bacterium]